jgi:hypothetical protein
VVALRPAGSILRTGGAFAAIVAAGAAASAASAGPRHAGAQAAAAGRAPAGLFFGGVTPQSWPIVLELDRRARRVARIVTGLDMTCTSRENFSTTDGFTGLPISSRGRFRMTYGPQRIDAGGTPAEIQGSITGRRSRSRSSFKGTWTYRVTFYDAAGTTAVDTCESGLVSWRARQ